MGIFSRHPFDDEQELNGDHHDDDERGLLRPRNIGWAALAVLIVIVAFGCWLGFKVQAAKSNLEQARHSAQQAKDALLQGNPADASKFAVEAETRAQAAREAAHSMPWSVAASIPWLGSPLKTGQQISDVAMGLTSDVLKPTVDAGATIAPDQLLADGRLDVVALRQEGPTLSKLAAAAAHLDADAKGISNPGYLSVIADARSKLQSQTSDIAKLLENTALAARLAPSMMGADGPRNYFMGFQTNAEARGTGGLLGGFGILHFDNGTPTMDSLGSNMDLDKKFASLDLGQEFANQYTYANPTTDWRNSNMSSHFPYAAQIWKSMWAQQTGMNVDGAIAIDPVALSYILGALGPVRMPDGETISKENVVELTESTAYVRFPDDQLARKQYLQDIAAQVVKKMSGPVKSPRGLLDALGRAVSERRISVWSATPDEQKLLEQTPLAHEIPTDPAPYAEVVVNNLGGNKMDYYLDRQIEYVADDCDGQTRMSTVTVRLTNSVTNVASLPEYVAGKIGFPKKSALNVPDGTMLTSVRLLTTTGASVISVLVNGNQIQAFGEMERGHPAIQVPVSIPPGKTAEMVFRLSEPTVPGAARVPVQPLTDNVNPKVAVPECSG